MFWWGNYIPAGTHWSNSAAKGFDLQELIDNIENPRGHLGTGPAADKVWGQETKYWGHAVKADK
jgi:hypothetical protein